MEDMILKGKYRHYKGNEYEVIDVGTHSENGEKLVVYRALYGDHELWIRPLNMFMENIDHDGVSTPRFKFLGNIDESSEN